MHPIHFLSHWNAEILALANLFIAVGTVVLAAGIPWSIAVSRRDQRDTFYATLDQTYFEIQKLIIENPHLARVGHEGKTPEQIAQYDAFAFVTWNFVESIYDYAILGNDDVLRNTWECILRYEARRHAAWFQEPRNHDKFEDGFREWIVREECLTAPRRPVRQANGRAAGKQRPHK